MRWRNKEYTVFCWWNLYTCMLILMSKILVIRDPDLKKTLKRSKYFKLVLPGNRKFQILTVLSDITDISKTCLKSVKSNGQS